MHTGRHYSLDEVIRWTRRETYIFLVIMAIPTVAFQVLGWTWLSLSWSPIALVGTAVAFITGFNNSAAYGRLWEARQVWGGIINASRTWGMMVADLVAAPDSAGVRRALIHRQIAWMTALRYQLREARAWETMCRSDNTEYLERNYVVAEWDGKLDDLLSRLLDPAELSGIASRKNRTTPIIALQSKALREGVEAGWLSDSHRLALMNVLATFLELQGKCERLKNYPYPRQFATLNLIFVWMFILLLPFGLIHEFQELGPGFVWLAIPAGVAVAWVLHTIDKIGESSSNPFEGGPNDVPITALSRVAEIDLRESIGETDVPPPIEPVNNLLL